MPFVINEGSKPLQEESCKTVLLFSVIVWLATLTFFFSPQRQI